MSDIRTLSLLTKDVTLTLDGEGTVALVQETIGILSEREQGPTGPPGEPGQDGDGAAVDPGDLTLIFANKLI